jgi:hypothetical protein
MVHEGHLLLVLHAPPEPDDMSRRGRYFWRRPDGTWTSSDLGDGRKALLRHLDEYAEEIEKLDDQGEAATSAREYFDVLRALAPIHRASRNLHMVLHEARRLCPEDRDLIVLRDRAYEIERMADLAFAEAKTALDFTVALNAEHHARSSLRMALSSHRLNVLVAFFFPLATLGTIFGMNLQHGLEMDSAPLPFILVLLTGLVAGILLKSYVTAQPRTPKHRAGRQHARTLRDAGSRRAAEDGLNPPPDSGDRLA